jgi:hypothetical protein
MSAAIGEDAGNRNALTTQTSLRWRHDSVIEGMAAVLTYCLWFISSSGKSCLQSPVHSTGRIEVKKGRERVSTMAVRWRTGLMQECGWTILEETEGSESWSRREGGTVDREGEREDFLKGTTIQSQVKVTD